ncbi:MULTISPECIES: GNAT family N-acetyltransferase [unclassified Pseudodesulfovibrio]|uniref:GNAT family N-acetyltransferase n=1 Tax=unclassified Pseudodesulfovibrio TaxID=2661612 RepID=UPI000FEB8BEA|nr:MULTISPECIES: GNAT family N-acetyltransferase [unclassified Pseudodesulfovibrio]MCJ2166208.1 GNAT family N-acetyltransferase [Pseudodesulfovibrio sp. S3-i]RWU02338.1 N-acetyltransferase [Pseudodesulfovibrio sp. S3]
MTAILRPVKRADIDAICTLLHEHMNSDFSIERWGALFSTGWCSNRPDLGIVAEYHGRIVGFHGHVCSHRVINGRRERFVNFTSWYILKEFRGQGLGSGMLQMATADPNVTYTVFSLSPKRIEFFRTMGLDVLEEERLLWRKTGEVFDNLELTYDPETIRKCCDPGDIRVFDDHRDLAVMPVLVSTRCTQCLLLISKAVKHGGVMYYDVLYRSNSVMFSNRVQHIAEALLPDNDCVLAVDRRFLDGGVAGEVELIKSPRFYKSSRVLPCDIDLAYSEITLLDLKLD